MLTDWRIFPYKHKAPLIVCIQTGKLFEGNQVEGSRHFVTFSLCHPVWYFCCLVLKISIDLYWWTTYCPICTDGPHIVQFVLMGHTLSSLYWWATYCPICIYGPRVVQFVLTEHTLSSLYWWATYCPICTDGPLIVQFVLMGHILSSIPTLVKEKMKFNCQTTKCTLK